jgi:hypothetical protein
MLLYVQGISLIEAELKFVTSIFAIARHRLAIDLRDDFASFRQKLQNFMQSIACKHRALFEASTTPSKDGMTSVSKHWLEARIL